MSSCGVYRIQIGADNFYFGSSVNLDARRNAHLSDLKAGRHHNKWMQRAWNKHQDFQFEVVEVCVPETVLESEQKYLDQWAKTPGNMNMATLAQGGCGPLTEEHRQKISSVLSGRNLSEEHKANLRKPKSAETRKRMSEAAQRRTKETCLKIAETLRGHEVPQETRDKISASLKARHQLVS